MRPCQHMLILIKFVRHSWSDTLPDPERLLEPQVLDNHGRDDFLLSTIIIALSESKAPLQIYSQALQHRHRYHHSGHTPYTTNIVLSDKYQTFFIF